MHSNLILVADQAHARIFVSSNQWDSLTEIGSMENPKALLREQDLVTDVSGGNPHDKGRHGEIHAHIAAVFAQEINRTLCELVANNDIKKIYIIAAPHFLGVLRKHWDKNIVHKIALEIAKDLAKLPTEQILSHLPDFV